MSTNNETRQKSKDCSEDIVYCKDCSENKISCEDCFDKFIENFLKIIKIVHGDTDSGMCRISPSMQLNKPEAVYGDTDSGMCHIPPSMQLNKPMQNFDLEKIKTSIDSIFSPPPLKVEFENSHRMLS